MPTTRRLSSPAAIDLLTQGQIALSKVSAVGIRVDVEYLTSTIASIEKQIADKQKELTADKTFKVWRRRFRDRTNLGSRAQLAEVLFNQLGYKSKDVTDTGRAKTDKGSLEHIDLPFVKLFLQTENLKKTLGTYLLGIRQEMVRHADGRYYVHPIYNLNSAATYRSSAQLINIQNQPKRDQEMMRFVRQCFLPLPGHRFGEPDFGTLEVRIMYTYSHCPALRKYLTDPSTDMHRDTACDLFLLPPELIDKKTTRDCAKNRMVFATFYGSSWMTPGPGKMGTAQNTWDWLLQKDPVIPGTDKKLRKHLAEKGIKSPGSFDPKADPKPGTWAHHVRSVEQKLWKRFKGHNDWRKWIWEEYQNTGLLRFHTGFVIHIVHKRNDIINYPVQGAAFHCLLWSVIRLVNWLERKRMRSRVLGQIHDCIVLSLHPKEVDAVLTKAREIMSVELPAEWDWINIPLPTETDVGEVDGTWADLKVWDADEENHWSLKS